MRLRGMFFLFLHFTTIFPPPPPWFVLFFSTKWFFSLFLFFLYMICVFDSRMFHLNMIQMGFRTCILSSWHIPATTSSNSGTFKFEPVQDLLHGVRCTVHWGMRRMIRCVFWSKMVFMPAPRASPWPPHISWILTGGIFRRKRGTPPLPTCSPTIFAVSSGQS